MIKTRRLRIFAGPNGSGKSTFINQVRHNPPAANFKLGYYVNADDIERALKNGEEFNFDTFGIRVSSALIRSYFKRSKFSPLKSQIPDLYTKVSVTDQKLFFDKAVVIDSYIAADLAEFIRQQLLKNALSFSYETVMSNENKIDFLKKAKRAGYKVYLYYFATEDPLINIDRIRIRVRQKGHDVDKAVVEKRYYKSLKNLKPAIRASDRAYLFDTSKQVMRLISEIANGKHVTMADLEDVPYWFIKHVVN